MSVLEKTIYALIADIEKIKAAAVVSGKAGDRASQRCLEEKASELYTLLHSINSIDPYLSQPLFKKYFKETE